MAALLGAAVLGACSKDEGSVASLCAALEEGAHETTFAGFDPRDRDGALDRLREARVQLGDLFDDAPSEVRDELQIEIDYVQALIDALEDVPAGDAEETALRIQAVTDAHPEVRQAADDLGAYAVERC